MWPSLIRKQSIRKNPQDNGKGIENKYHGYNKKSKLYDKCL